MSYSSSDNKITICVTVIAVLVVIFVVPLEIKFWYIIVPIFVIVKIFKWFDKARSTYYLSGNAYW